MGERLSPTPSVPVSVAVAKTALCKHTHRGKGSERLNANLAKLWQMPGNWEAGCVCVCVFPRETHTPTQVVLLFPAQKMLLLGFWDALMLLRRFMPAVRLITHHPGVPVWACYMQFPEHWM